MHFLKIFSQSALGIETGMRAQTRRSVESGKTGKKNGCPNGHLIEKGQKVPKLATV